MKRFSKIFLFSPRFLLCAFLLSMSMPIALAATLTGTIYDSSLDRMNDVVVTLDTTPNQQFVAKDGTYSFQVPQGEYTLTVTYIGKYDEEINATEKVLVKTDGEFVYDIILFFDVSLSDIDELENDLIDISDDLKIIEEATEKRRPLILYWFVAVLIAIVIAILFAVKKRSPSKKVAELMIEDSDKVLKYIKTEGGRVTQKMLREAFPFSEAKVSLIVSELEHKGALQKIKRGKGNIIILKKKK